MNIIESIRSRLKMQSYIENTDLNINSWLIKWGHMNGYLQDGKIQATKYTIVYQWIVITIMLLNTIRFGILLFNPKGSLICYQLGDWSYFLGPRLIINGICFVGCCYAIMVIAFFKFFTRNLKMKFYWLKIMEYDHETRCFFNMNLNEFDSKMFIRRVLLFIILFKCFTVLLISCFAIINLLSAFIQINDHYLNHFIGIMIYLPSIYHCCGNTFGSPIILYLVSLKLININYF